MSERPQPLLAAPSSRRAAPSWPPGKPRCTPDLSSGVHLALCVHCAGPLTPSLPIATILEIYFPHDFLYDVFLSSYFIVRIHSITHYVLLLRLPGNNKLSVVTFGGSQVILGFSTAPG